MEVSKLLVGIFTIQILFIPVFLFLHWVHLRRARQYQTGLCKKVEAIEKNIKMITEELMPYLENLAKQRDKYKAKLKAIVS